MQCHLADFRQRRGFSAAVLAKRVGVQRQTIHAIEAGSYVPNTSLALLLARELEVTVEDLFHLPSGLPQQPQPIRARIVTESPVSPGAHVRLARLGETWLGFPQNAAPTFLSDADGIVTQGGNPGKLARVQTVSVQETADDLLLVAGCDPALGLLAAAAVSVAGIRVLPVSACSQTALGWLKNRYVHVAGCHIEDRSTGEFNLPALKKCMPGESLTVLTFAEWEEGFVVAPGNPLGLREAGDLANPAVRLVNREAGSGSRALLDSLLATAGVSGANVNGYRTIAASHLAAARAVHQGHADCCIATSSAALVFQLDFLPLRRERFDLVFRKEYMHLPAVRALLDALHRQSFRRKLESLAGYDTARSGNKVID